MTLGNESQLLIAEVSYRWGAPQWAIPAALIFVLALAFVLIAYARSPGRGALRIVCAIFKGAAFLLLVACLLEPMIHDVRPRPGANLFLVVADNSQSLTLHDADAEKSRGEQLVDYLDAEQSWQTRLGQDFDVRRYMFDTRLRPIAEFAQLSLDGAQTALVNSLSTLDQRYEGRPVAGMLLLTDGNATDLGTNRDDWHRLPPIYPVVVGGEESNKDISLTRVTVTQSNFEIAPTSVTAEFVADGWGDEPIVVQLLNQQGEELQRQQIEDYESSRPTTLRFQLKPQGTKIGFYRVRAIAAAELEAGEADAATEEATQQNNSQTFVVDPGKGPYRVLYVAGRPNWEFKFLRRAVEADNEIDLVGMIRIAKKEPKFSFRGRAGESSNPLFRGFGNQDPEDVEQYDEPVLLRYGIDDDSELGGGFPKTAEELFSYDAVILDDLEASFFTQDQMLLLQRFVTQRGGGFLMLGGKESFVQGGYRRTPIGEMLPVYLDRLPSESSVDGFRFALTREGWLEPWARLRPTEAEEWTRLKQMPPF